MASTAISAQGTSFAVAGTPGGAITITAITKANPAVTTGTNTLAVGDVVIFGAVTNMPEINARIGIVTAASGSAFTVNIDASGFAAAGTSGTAAPQTWTTIGNIHDYTGFDGVAPEIDVSNLQSLAKEYYPGLEDFGQMSLNVDVNPADTGQLALRAAKTSTNKTYFKMITRSANVRAWNGFVKKFSEAGSVDGVLKGSVDIRISGRPAFSEVVN